MKPLEHARKVTVLWLLPHSLFRVWPLCLTIFTALLLPLFVAGCGAARIRPSAELRVVTEPEGARVYVDDQFAGVGRVLSQSPERLSTGAHFVTVTAPDYFPHDVEVDLPEGLTTLEVSLRPVPR